MQKAAADLPDLHSIISAPAGIQIARAILEPVAQPTLMSDIEILTLLRTALKVQQHFAPLYGVESSKLKLDIEFKLRAGDRALVFKQVRPYYQSSQP